MTHACLTWEYAADAHPLKLHRLQSRVLGAVGNHDRCTPVRELHVAFKILYVHNNISKVCRTQAEVILNHINPNVRGAGQGETMLRSVRCLNMAAVRPTTVQITNCSFRVVI
jgi:hypothetical protein